MTKPAKGRGTEATAPGPARLKPRLRVVRDREVLLGPGMAELLDATRRSGSLRLAACELGMSYMHARGLVKTMNRGFREPLVELSRGGAERGGARLSARGEEVLALYREMEAEARRGRYPEPASVPAPTIPGQSNRVRGRRPGPARGPARAASLRRPPLPGKMGGCEASPS